VTGVVGNNRIRLRRLMCSSAALLYLFVFAGVDFLHAHDCPFRTGHAGHSDGLLSVHGCHACLFKAGANSSDPDCTPQLEFAALLFVQILPCSSTPDHCEFALCASIRAPPSICRSWLGQVAQSRASAI